MKYVHAGIASSLARSCWGQRQHRIDMANSVEFVRNQPHCNSALGEDDQIVAMFAYRSYKYLRGTEKGSGWAVRVVLLLLCLIGDTTPQKYVIIFLDYCRDYLL